MDLLTKLRNEVAIQNRKVRAGDALAMGTVRLLNETINEFIDMQKDLDIARKQSRIVA